MGMNFAYLSGMLLALLLSCAPAPVTDSAAAPQLPGHNDCLPEGEAYSDEVCLAVVEADGRYPGYTEDKTDGRATADDPRLDDPDYQWLTDQASRCVCACCHRARYEGPGIYFWDLDYEPVWIDTASTWSLRVFAGWTDEVEQTLPTDDPERLRAAVQAELDRRYAD